MTIGVFEFQPLSGAGVALQRGRTAERPDFREFSWRPRPKTTVVRQDDVPRRPTLQISRPPNRNQRSNASELLGRHPLDEVRARRRQQHGVDAFPAVPGVRHLRGRLERGQA